MVHLCSTTYLLMRDKLKTAFELLESEEEPIRTCGHDKEAILKRNPGADHARKPELAA